MSTTENGAPIKAIALGDLENELRMTRAVLERVPDDKLDWKPHDKSFSLGALALHIARLPTWITRTLESDHFDLSSVSRQAPAASKQEIMDAFDETVAAVRAAAGATSDAALLETWELRMGDKVMMSLPRTAIIRTMGLSHLIHHRGQLGVYLRLLDVPLPALYGPSADERPDFM
jgi:uncharacterized damage-inducible protein DinB